MNDETNFNQPLEDVDTLLEKLSYPDPRVISQAAFALSWYDDPRQVEPLLRLLKCCGEGLRWAAVHGLANVITDEVEEALIRHLATDPAASVRAACVPLLAQRGKKCLEAVFSAAGDADPEVRSAVALALMAVRSKGAKQVLKGMLSDAVWKVRYNACTSLVHQKAVDSHVIEALEQVAREPEAEKHNQKVQTARTEFRKRMENSGSEHWKTIEGAMMTIEEEVDAAKAIYAKRSILARLFGK